VVDLGRGLRGKGWNARKRTRLVVERKDELPGWQLAYIWGETHRHR